MGSSGFLTSYLFHSPIPIPSHPLSFPRYLEYCRDESKIRSQDFFSTLGYIADNPVGNSLVWDWVRANYDYLLDR